ncbi:hypothetical protein cand_020260 [Cryptosporidium andersoni]|uniref:Uncharacterized protein n=1 Tax=Cryptosporidium andersoni TaxID=117008 RepID=A0A1J4MWA2_9CRYT|nr:hypothetical protein cand_020260 [Cryptosporidium andersoni]
MVFEYNCSLQDNSLVNILLYRSSGTRVGFFDTQVSLIKQYLSDISNSAEQLINLRSIEYSCLGLKEIDDEVATSKLKFKFICEVFTGGQTALSFPYIQTWKCIFAMIIISEEEKLTIDNKLVECINNSSYYILDFIYVFDYNNPTIEDSNSNIRWCKVSESVPAELMNHLKYIYIGIVDKMIEIFKLSINSKFDIIFAIEGESGTFTGPTSLRRQKKFLGDILVLLGLPIAACHYYNTALEVYSETSAQSMVDIASCLEGQSKALYSYYNNSNLSVEWWQVIVHSAASFLSEIPTPLQHCFLPLPSHIPVAVDTITFNQTRKLTLFDMIIKRLKLALSLMEKVCNIQLNPISLPDTLSFTKGGNKVFPLFELVLKVAKILANGIFTYYQTNRKLVADFLDPYFKTVFTAVCEMPLNHIQIFTYFLMGCTLIYQSIGSHRRVGVILFYLARLFQKNKLYVPSYNISCINYIWYSDLFNKDSVERIDLTSLPLMLINGDEKSNRRHFMCKLCRACGFYKLIMNIANLKTKGIRNTYFHIEKDHSLHNTHYLHTSYLQYLSIYKHDLSLNYKGSLIGELKHPEHLQTNKSGVIDDALIYLTPFIYDFSKYGIHTLLHIYRCHTKNKFNRLVWHTHPMRYELICLLLILQASISYSCSSGSIWALCTLVENLAYLPPYYDIETVKMIQSKCIDALTVVSTSALLAHREPTIYVATNQLKDAIEIQSEVTTLFGNLKSSLPSLLLYKITFDTTSRKRICTHCNKDEYSHFDEKNNLQSNSYYECYFKSIHTPLWFGWHISIPDISLEVCCNNISDTQWIPLQETSLDQEHIFSEVADELNEVYNSDLFLYNPYEKRKPISSNGNQKRSSIISTNSPLDVLWTCGTAYTISVSLFNSLFVPLVLDSFHVIISGEVECDVYPVSVVIPPTTRFCVPGSEVKVAINVTPRSLGRFAIIGISYKFAGIKYTQYGYNKVSLNNKTEYSPHLIVTVIPQVPSFINLSWEQFEKDTLTDNVLQNKIYSGILWFENQRLEDCEQNQYNSLFSLESTSILLSKEDHELCKGKMELSLVKPTVLERQGVIINCNCLPDIEKICLKYSSRYQFNGKNLLVSYFATIFTRICPSPNIVNVQVLPILNYIPSNLPPCNSNRWDASEYWIICTLENTSQTLPLKFSLAINKECKEKFSEEIHLPPETRGYRWMFRIPSKYIGELCRNPNLPLLAWSAYYPQALYQKNVNEEIEDHGFLFLKSTLPQCLSHYRINWYIECNGESLPNNSVFPCNSILQISIVAQPVNNTIDNTSIRVRILPYKIHQYSKIIYIENEQEDSSFSTEMSKFSFCIIGLERKMFQWVVGIEEMDLITYKSTLHWKSELLSISFN